MDQGSAELILLGLCRSMLKSWCDTGLLPIPIKKGGCGLCGITPLCGPF